MPEWIFVSTSGAREVAGILGTLNDFSAIEIMFREQDFCQNILSSNSESTQTRKQVLVDCLGRNDPKMLHRKCCATKPGSVMLSSCYCTHWKSLKRYRTVRDRPHCFRLSCNVMHLQLLVFHLQYDSSKATAFFTHVTTHNWTNQNFFTYSCSLSQNTFPCLPPKIELTSYVRIYVMLHVVM